MGNDLVGVVVLVDGNDENGTQGAGHPLAKLVRRGRQAVQILGLHVIVSHACAERNGCFGECELFIEPCSGAECLDAGDRLGVGAECGLLKQAAGREIG